MKKEFLYDNLLNAIKEKFPLKTNMVSALVDLLCIEKEAVYRRLRGEVAFTFAEIVTIANAFGISLDNIVGAVTAKSRPFQLKLVDFLHPVEIDYDMLDQYIDILSLAREDDMSELIDCTNILPQQLYMKYTYISRFYLFKWLYQCGKPGKTKRFDEIKATDRFAEMQIATVEESRYIRNSYYILDPLIFHYLVNDINYFMSINLLNTDDIKHLKDELMELLDELETLAARGSFEDTGNKVFIYISSVNFDTSYWCVQVNNYRISMIKTFILSSVASLDEGTYVKLRKWLRALIRSSIMISVSGERQRIAFFKAQRELIQSM